MLEIQCTNFRKTYAVPSLLSNSNNLKQGSNWGVSKASIMAFNNECWWSPISWVFFAYHQPTRVLNTGLNGIVSEFMGIDPELDWPFRFREFDAKKTRGSPSFCCSVAETLTTDNLWLLAPTYRIETTSWPFVQSWPLQQYIKFLGSHIQHILMSTFQRTERIAQVWCITTLRDCHCVLMIVTSRLAPKRRLRA